MRRAIVPVELALLHDVKCRPRFRERVQALRTVTDAPPIPVRVGIHGQISLDRDGNHRLAAAREAGRQTVFVAVDPRDTGRLAVALEQRRKKFLHIS